MDPHNLLPRSKFDFSNLKKLEVLRDDDFDMLSIDLLTWLQDKNWPIYQKILKIVILRQDLLMKEIQGIMSSDDDIWKQNLVDDVIPKLSEKNLLEVKDKRII